MENVEKNRRRKGNMKVYVYTMSASENDARHYTEKYTFSKRRDLIFG